ncbi:TadE/TadG family type IV pilus assembly protein [Nitrosomonas sp. Nm33]|uniref:TadE/TadG family type IV pilus assembly protein n=1 Tax=Nitrosomonas sp. Nm33 TaxID=133724 RepID=UPI0015A43C9B|nr:TadE/TadG family type IV pilus assembly protein [Nitrosomonas sp. Nm33]
MFNHSLDSQRGVIALITAISLVTLLSFASLAIDLGYAYVVRNEIQNAADTAALNGARFLYPMVGGSNKTPNWPTAEREALNAIRLNKVSNSFLSTGNVTTGYWDITGNIPDIQAINGVNSLAAVKVVINKNNNGGPISTFFAKVLGVNFIDVSATAVAVVASPGRLENNNLFPIAISKCMFDSFWDSQNNAPKVINDPNVQKDNDLKNISPNLTQYMFQIKEKPDKNDPCAQATIGELSPTGQWSSLTLGTNNVSDIRNLIDYSRGVKTPPENYGGNSLGVGDNIWIEPGTKTTLYSNVNDCSDNIDGSGDNTCAYTVVPIVTNVVKHAQNPIIGFACLNIIKAVGDSTKATTARVVAKDDPITNGKCKVSGTGGGAVNTGVTLPPKLVNYSGNTY